MTTRTDRICVPHVSEPLDDHTRHGHVDGVTHVSLGECCDCVSPAPVEVQEFGSRFAYTRCAGCGQTL